MLLEFKEKLIKKYGEEEARKRIYVTTDKEKGLLRKEATEEGYETFIVPDNIGGRYSVLTPVGLLPIAVAGIDIDKLIFGAESAMIKYSSLEDNDCYKYAVIRNILNKNFDDVYTSKTDCLTPEIVFEFKSEIEFNTFVLDEAIEYGHKIRGFELSAFVDDDWISVWQGECVGYRCAEHFDIIKTKKIKLKITNAVDSPIIRFFGIYNINNDWFKVENARFSNENIMRNGLAFVERDGDCFDVNLGGVIPFNKIFFEGDRIENYELYIFDGSKYILYSSKDNVNQERIECAFSGTIDWAYKFRINVLKKKKEIEHLKIEVYFN